MRVAVRCAILTAALVAGLPSARGQDGYPPGLELRPLAPGAQVAPEPGWPAGTPLLESARPPSPWYADGELAVLFTGAVHFNDYVAAVEGDRIVYLSPRVFLGRRLENGGAIRFTYRNLTEVGTTGGAPEPRGDWSSEQTFTTNWFDLDYVTREFAPLDWWRVQGEVGGRFVFRYAGSRDGDSYGRYDFSQTYFAGGPHLGLTSRLLLGQSGWALYGRADTAVTFGGGSATSRYRPLYPDAAERGDFSRSERQSYSALQFDLGLQLGLVKRWEWRGRTVGLGAGVQADVLTLGDLGGDKFNAFGLVNVGPFVRWELRY